MVDTEKNIEVNHEGVANDLSEVLKMKQKVKIWGYFYTFSDKSGKKKHISQLKKEIARKLTSLNSKKR